MERVLIGDTITCPKCGQKVTATVEAFSNLTVLIGQKHCTDGDYHHPWPVFAGLDVPFTDH